MYVCAAVYADWLLRRMSMCSSLYLCAASCVIRQRRAHMCSCVSLCEAPCDHVSRRVYAVELRRVL